MNHTSRDHNETAAYRVALTSENISFDLSRAELFASFGLFTVMPISASFTAFEDSVDLVGKVQTRGREDRTAGKADIGTLPSPTGSSRM